jgi:hypothetical protein
MSQSDYIHQKRNAVVFQLQNQKKMPPVLNSMDYTEYKTFTSTMLPNTNTHRIPNYNNELPLQNIQYIFDTKQNIIDCTLQCPDIKLANHVLRADVQLPNPTKKYIKQIPLNRVLDARYIDSLTSPEQKKNKPSNHFYSAQLYSTKRYLDTIRCACTDSKLF